MKNNLNLLFAAIFMMGFLFFWDSVVMKRYNSAPARSTAAKAQDPKSVEHSPLPESELTTALQGPNPKEESLTLLETPEMKVSILSRGARVASWQLKERNHWIELVVPEKNRVTSPLETFPEINFGVQQKTNTSATFVATLPSGVVMKKELELLAQPPFHKITMTFTNPTKSDAAVNGQINLGNGLDKHVVGEKYDEKQEGMISAEARAVTLSSVVKSWKPGFIFHRTIDLSENGPFKWVAVDNHHFMNAFVSADEKGIPGSIVVADRKHPPMAAVPLRAVLKPGESTVESYLMYVGPKSYDNLKALGHNLDQAVDFGFFGVIAKVLLKMLNFFESLSGNYGWAIIALTFCIQLVVFPLTRKNLQYSVKMRELQPHIKKLQEQYKSDPKRLQVETFNFYKKNNMKFMGMEGCFPMLLQLPVFFAFYSTLNVAYELRGAPWIFWIKDLGVADPTYVLPIIMGLGMLVQQKMTAVAADPAQAKMMMFMPIIFTFMFLKLPAGLVLYWCVNSLTTIVIQLVLKPTKKIDPQLAT